MNRVKFDDKKFYNFAVALLGALLLAINFNVFLKPNNLVISGVSGLSLVVNHFSGMDTSLFIAIANVLLIILSIAALGYKSSIRTIIGSIAYSIFLFLTEDINASLGIYFDDFIMNIIVGGTLSGVAAGLIYRSGYTSGGSDVLTMIVAKYGKKDVGKSQLIINSIVVILGGLVFGITLVFYAVLYNYIESIIIDKVQLGFGSTKKFLICTDKPQELKDYIIKVLHSDVTEFDVTGAYSNKKKKMLMCTISTKRYLELQEVIKAIDDDAFITISECYNVLGGTKS